MASRVTKDMRLRVNKSIERIYKTALTSLVSECFESHSISELSS